MKNNRAKNSEAEKDWRTFRDMLPELRERYITGLNKEIQTQLGQDITATEIFWNLKEFIDEKAITLQECLDVFSRSNMDLKMMMMVSVGMMTNEDLDLFSDALATRIRNHCGI